jgi:uncharacterized protein (DUF2236 family)
MLGSARAAIAKAYWSATWKEQLPGVQFTDPPGDPGLFGPGSPIWYAHSDVSGLVGGVAGLIIGGLNEPIMHGTNQHSAYSDDPARRLGHTVSFVHAMTYGGMPVVEKMVSIVRKMHTRVHGNMPDGRPYSAVADTDVGSANMIWTGVTQAYGIMLAHRLYHPKPLSDARVDEYYAQYARISRLLGAVGDIPSSRAEVDAYFAEIRPRLTYSEETADLLRFFTSPYGDTSTTRAGSVLISRAAIDVMPGWAKELYRIPQGRARSATTRATTRTLLAVLRSSLGEPFTSSVSRKRAEAAPVEDTAEKPAPSAA